MKPNQELIAVAVEAATEVVVAAAVAAGTVAVVVAADAIVTTIVTSANPAGKNCRGGPPWPPSLHLFLFQNSNYLNRWAATDGRPYQLLPRFRFYLQRQLLAGSHNFNRIFFA